ncbi:MAG: hypothetical protein ACE5OZ_18290 [Candidatus Heimdallarchaeota archaeon]
MTNASIEESKAFRILKFGIKHGYSWYGLISIVVVYAFVDIAYPFYLLNDKGVDLSEEWLNFFPLWVLVCCMLIILAFLARWVNRKMHDLYGIDLCDIRYESTSVPHLREFFENDPDFDAFRDSIEENLKQPSKFRRVPWIIIWALAIGFIDQLLPFFLQQDWRVEQYPKILDYDLYYLGFRIFFLFVISCWVSFIGLGALEFIIKAGKSIRKLKQFSPTLIQKKREIEKEFKNAQDEKKLEKKKRGIMKYPSIESYRRPSGIVVWVFVKFCLGVSLGLFGLLMFYISYISQLEDPTAELSFIIFRILIYFPVFLYSLSALVGSITGFYDHLATAKGFQSRILDEIYKETYLFFTGEDDPKELDKLWKEMSAFQKISEDLRNTSAMPMNSNIFITTGIISTIVAIVTPIVAILSPIIGIFVI